MVSIGGVSAAPTPPLDMNKVVVLSREERLARYAQAREAQAARAAAGPVDQVEISDPAQQAILDQIPARRAQALAQIAAMGLPLPSDSPAPAGSGDPALLRHGGHTAAAVAAREALLGMLAPDGLGDVIEAERGREAAEEFRAGIRKGIHDFDRRLGWEPTDFTSDPHSPRPTPVRVDLQV